MAAAPVAVWPSAAVTSDGRRVGLGEALGPGGELVERLLERLLVPPSGEPATELAVLAAATPVGRVDLPLDVVCLQTGVEVSADIDPSWLAAVDEQRSTARAALVAAGRGVELEAALHVAMLLGIEIFDPEDDEDCAAHIASGAQLWLLGGAVAWCLSVGVASPFAPWAELVARGWWPVGPTRGRLVIAVGSGCERG